MPLPCIPSLKMKITNISKQKFKKLNCKGHMKIATRHDLPPRFVVQNASKILATLVSMLPMLGFGYASTQ